MNLNKNEVAEQCSQRALSHVLKSGFDDIYQTPIFVGHFERAILASNPDFQKEIVASTARAILQNRTTEMAFSPVDSLLYPKERFAYRKYSYIEPIDNLKYLALVLHIAGTIEGARPDRRRGIVHSYRFNKVGDHIFSQSFNFQSFKSKSRELTRKNVGGFKVLTDIANFYDRVNIHRIESTLFGCGCDQEVSAKINSLLLLWSGKDSYGLPVGCDASRLLAEAALIDVDNFLLSHNVNFLRFVDDYRIFASTREEASYSLSLLTQRLYREGLNLNSHKTSIVRCEAETTEGDHQETLIVEPESASPTEAEIRPRIVSLYGEKVRLRFQPPSEIERERLSKLNLDDLRESAPSGDNFAALRDFARAAVIQRHSPSIMAMIEVSKSFIFMTSYIVDLLIKEASNLPEDLRGQVRTAFSDWSKGQGLKPEFVQVCINRLLSSNQYLDVDAVMLSLRRAPRAGGSIVLREAILQIYEHLSRDQILEVRDYFFKSSDPEKRAIVHAFIDAKVVHKDEKRPWLSMVQTYSQDPFVKRMVQRALKK